MGLEILGDVLRLMVLVGLGIAGALAVVIWKKNKASRVTYIRFVIQAVAFGALFYVFSYSSVIPMLYEFIFIFVLTIFLGRFFCGWLCPFGLIMDIESAVRKALKIRYRLIPNKLNIALNKSRYAILLAFLLLPAVLWVLNPDPLMASPLMVELFAGHFRPYSITLDPMIPFIVPWSNTQVITLTTGLSLSYPYTQEVITYIAGNIGLYLAIAFTGVTLVGGFFIRRVWCRFCPTGASLGVVNRFPALKRIPLLHIQKDEQKCTKCGVCKRVCTVQVNEVYDQKGGRINTSQCMVCARCVEMCPYEGTLKLQLGNKTVFKSRNWLEPSTSE